MKTYKRNVDGMTLWVSADWAQAASGIWMAWTERGEREPADDSGKWRATPFQVADVGHNYRKALKMCRDWTGSGCMQR